MKILIIAQYFYPDFGGASTRAFNVAKGLVNLGNTVKVVTAFPHYPHGRVPSRYKRKAVMFEEMDDIVSRMEEIKRHVRDEMKGRTKTDSSSRYIT